MKRALRPMRSATGFTLVELMIVVLVIGILAILALPGFSTWLQNSRTRSVSESMQNGLRFAQGEAARRSRLTTFTPSGTGWTATYTQTSGDTGSTTLQAAAESNLGTVTISPTTAVSFNSFGRAGTITAGVFTQATADTTYQVTNTKGNRRLNVIVSAGGKVRMCDPDKTFSSTTPDGC